MYRSLPICIRAVLALIAIALLPAFSFAQQPEHQPKHHAVPKAAAIPEIAPSIAERATPVKNEAPLVTGAATPLFPEATDALLEEPAAPKEDDVIPVAPAAGNSDAAKRDRAVAPAPRAH